jgi:TRAP-type mannitol/chloroaromatic compound transport system permease small subunit
VRGFRRGRLVRVGSGRLKVLLKISAAIDAMNEKFGVIANYLVLFAALISAGNAGSR